MQNAFRFHELDTENKSVSTKVFSGFSRLRPLHLLFRKTATRLFMRFPLHDTYGFCDRDFRKFLRQVDLPRMSPILLYDKWYSVLTKFPAENFAAWQIGFPSTRLLQKTIHAQPRFCTNFYRLHFAIRFAAHLCQIAKYCIICNVFLGGVMPLNKERGRKCHMRC